MEQYNRDIRPLHLPIPQDVDSIEVSSYPHKYLIFRNSSREEINSINIYELLFKQAPTLFEVLYIGRSYGRKRQLNIIDRLYNQNHKAFKHILIDIAECEQIKNLLF